jgi:hypothetical protein
MTCGIRSVQEWFLVTTIKYLDTELNNRDFVQQSSFLTFNLLFFLFFLSVAVFITALRFAAIKRYQTERRNVETKSALGSLGDRLSNTPFSLYNALHPVLWILVFISAMLLLEDQVSYESIQLLEITVLSGILFAMVVYFVFTMSGRVRWRVGRIEGDYQAFEHEEWVLQIRLAELVRDTQSSNSSRAEVAQRVLDNLMTKENNTGDTVRQIMATPEQLQDVQQDRTIPNPLRYFKYSLLLCVALIITMTTSMLLLSSGSYSGLEMATQFFFFSFVLTGALMCCVCLEGSSVTEKRRKFQSSFAES